MWDFYECFSHKILISNTKYIMSRNIYNRKERKLACIRHLLYGPSSCQVHVLSHLMYMAELLIVTQTMHNVNVVKLIQC